MRLRIYIATVKVKKTLTHIHMQWLDI